MAATYSDDVSGEASDKDDSLFNEKNHRFKFNGKQAKPVLFLRMAYNYVLSSSLST